MKRIFLCSPYAGLVKANTITAELLCREVVRLGHSPFAPHLHYTRFLSDAKERDLGISCGLAWLQVCDEVWAYTANGISPGMALEIAEAHRLGVPVLSWDGSGSAMKAKRGAP